MLHPQPLRGGIAMNIEQFQREKEYGAALAIAGALLKRNLITNPEYRKIKAALIKKHRPVISSLQQDAPDSSPRHG
ncbi:MAG: SHOCT domain-containing protein [Lachnospiraceae bacterium]